MPKQRITKQLGEYCRSFASEDGKHYRVETQNMDPVLKRVKYLGDKVNSAPKRNNKGQWSYAGSIPITVLTDWLRKNHYTWDQYARNEDGSKDKFKRFLEAEMPAFLAQRKKSSQILLPG